jgi:hypothetical protein
MVGVWFAAQQPGGAKNEKPSDLGYIRINSLRGYMHLKPASKRGFESLRRRLCPLLCNKVRHEKHHRVQRKLPNQTLPLSRSKKERALGEELRAAPEEAACVQTAIRWSFSKRTAPACSPDPYSRDVGFHDGVGQQDSAAWPGMVAPAICSPKYSLQDRTGTPRSFEHCAS